MLPRCKIHSWTIFVLWVVLKYYDFMDLITKNMFFTNYITFSKGDNSLKNNRILMIFFQNIQRRVMKLFCSWSSSHLFTPEEQIGKNWFSWRPSWIFGGHFEFFFGPGCFLEKVPCKACLCQVSCFYPLLKYFRITQAHYICFIAFILFLS